MSFDEKKKRRESGAMAMSLVVTETGSYSKLVNNGSRSLDAAALAVLSAPDNISSLKEEPRTAPKPFLSP